MDRHGNEVFKLERFNSIMGGQRTRDGQIFLTLSEGAVVRLDPRGNEVKRWRVGSVNNYGGVHALPGNRLLLALYSQNEVYEYDQDGKLLWSAKVQSPNFATRLPNGHTLVGSQDQRNMVELDRQGKVVSEYKPQQSVWRIHRR